MVPAHNDDQSGNEGNLADRIGRFIIEFNDLESYLAFDIANLISGSRDGDDTGRILNGTVMYGAKIKLWAALCRHHDFLEVTDELERNTYKLKTVVRKLEEIGAARNRLVHDETWPSSDGDHARVVRLNREGDPHGKGWLGDLFTENVDLGRDRIKKAMDLLSKFMLATQAEQRRRTQSK